VTSAGALTVNRLFALALTGAVASSGTMTRSVGKGLAGTVTLAGSVSKLIGRALGGLLGPTGLLGIFQPDAPSIDFGITTVESLTTLRTVGRIGVRTTDSLNPLRTTAALTEE
jgi:hypothetical protein